jgi:hypothetical protein
MAKEEPKKDAEKNKIIQIWDDTGIDEFGLAKIIYDYSRQMARLLGLDGTVYDINGTAVTRYRDENCRLSKPFDNGFQAKTQTYIELVEDKFSATKTIYVYVNHELKLNMEFNFYDFDMRHIQYVISPCGNYFAYYNLDRIIVFDIVNKCVLNDSRISEVVLGGRNEPRINAVGFGENGTIMIVYHHVGHPNFPSLLLNYYDIKKQERIRPDIKGYKRFNINKILLHDQANFHKVKFMGSTHLMLYDARGPGFMLAVYEINVDNSKLKLTKFIQLYVSDRHTFPEFTDFTLSECHNYFIGMTYTFLVYVIDLSSAKTNSFKMINQSINDITIHFSFEKIGQSFSFI